MTQGKDWTRRDFLRFSATATAAMPFWRPWSVENLDRPWLKRRGVVVCVEHSRVMDENGRVDRQVLGAMIDRALREFTGETDVGAGLAHFFNAEDVVGVKVNTLGLKALRRTHYLDHFSAFAEVTTDRLTRVLGKAERVIFWDRHNRDLRTAGFRINVEGPGPRCYGTQDTVGFEKQSYPVGEKRTRFSKILTQRTTALLNMPLVKTHRMAGVTGAMKNHYGSIDNPRDFHANNCTNPGIAELNALTPIREKTRLILVDALWAVIEQGPGWNLEFMRPLKQVWVSTDPVAVDRLVLDTLNRMRKAEKLPPRDQMARHIELAGKLGLGEHRMEKIDVVQLKLG